MLTRRITTSALATAAMATSALLIAPTAHAGGHMECDERTGACWIEVTTPGRPETSGKAQQPVVFHPSKDAGGKHHGDGGGGGYQRPPKPKLKGIYAGQEAVWSDGCGWTNPFTMCGVAAGQPRKAAPAPAAPGVPTAPVISPAQLAQQARSMLNLPKPAIGIVPKTGPGRMGVVGAPVWMWTPPQQWQPITATARAGALQVTAVAKLDQILWNMGDGTTVTCTTPGTPYIRAYGIRMSPDCGHRYEHTSAPQPGQAYTVRATATWTITWTGATAGTLQLPMTSTTALRIGEVQVIVTK